MTDNKTKTVTIDIDGLTDEQMEAMARVFGEHGVLTDEVLAEMSPEDKEAVLGPIEQAVHAAMLHEATKIVTDAGRQIMHAVDDIPPEVFAFARKAIDEDVTVANDSNENRAAKRIITFVQQVTDDYINLLAELGELAPNLVSDDE